jgi:hypothetical protein
LCNQTTVNLFFAKSKNGYIPGISQSDIDVHIARLERIFPLARERLRDATQDYTRALVQQYSTRLYHKLPRELCDIVYQYFHPPPLGDVYVSVSALGDVDFAHQDHFPGCFREYEWNIGYMGKAIIRELAREIIQPWYGSRKFILGKGRSANNNGCGLNQFLATDFWGIRLELAKSLQNIDSHYFDDITTAQSPRTAGSSLARERREDLSVGFRRLITPKPVGAHLNITLYTEDMGTAYKEGLGVPILETGLDMLLPILGELQKMG